MEVKELFDGVYSMDGRLATVNSKRGNKVYGEELVQLDGKEYRLWNPYRSKLAASILNGLKGMHIKQGSRVLYLGAATGTTASHVGDIASNGEVFCVEFSERNMRELIPVCEARPNMLPLLYDANDVDKYGNTVGTCDIIYQDVSARNQSEIMRKNSALLKKGGYAYFIIKSQSIDISRRPEEVFRQELKGLEGVFSIEEKIDLEPYDSLHLFAVLRKL